MVDEFLKSDVKVFINLSSVKALVDELDGFLTEENTPDRNTYYGESKLLVDRYVLSNSVPESMRVYILRP